MKPIVIPFSMPMFPGFVGDSIHPTLLVDSAHVILIDCGGVGALALLKEALATVHISITDLTELVLTHHDHDHMGCAAALKREHPQLKLLCSKQEYPYIAGLEKPLRLIQAEAFQKVLPPEQQAFGEAFCKMLRTVEPVAVDGLLDDGDYLPWTGRCRVLATPGHTPGHISFFCEEDGIVITGDAFALEQGEPVIANPQFTLDMQEAKRSMQKLIDLKSESYACYHGGSYARNA